MLRSLCCCSDERKVNVCSCCRRKLFLCFFSSFFQSLESHLVAGKIYALSSLKLCKHIVCDLLVKVVTTKAVVSCCGKNLDNTIADFNDGNIESTAAKVIYHDLLFFFIVKTICKSCCCRLVDDTFYIKTCNLTCILGCLTLSVIKVSRNCDNCFCYSLAKISLCIFFQLLKNHSGNFLRRIFLVVNCYTIIGTHLSLNGGDCFFCVGNCLTFCRLTYQTLSCFCKSYYGWCSSCTLCICDNGGLATFHNCHTTVCCS